MIESDLPLVRLGPTDRPVVHAYFDVCPESPDGERVLVTAFDGAAVPGPACVAVVARDGRLQQMIGDPVEAIGHVGRFALWIDDHRIAYRQGVDEAVGGWSILDLDTGQEVRREGALRQWHAGTMRGLVQMLGPTPNPHRLRQGIGVVDAQGRTVAEADACDCMAVVPKGFAAPPLEQTDVKNFKWSPDGSRFFVVFNNESYRNRVSRDVPRFKTIVSFDPQARDARFLGEFGHHPAWSLDGTFVYAMDRRDDGTQDLVALPADGSGRNHIVLRDVPGIHGSPMPGGRSFIIDVRSEDSTECVIARFDLATGAREDLARFRHTRWNHRDGFHPHPVASPDGRRIYFNAEAAGPCGCYALELNA